jgi:uncharacterized protein YndB with AHSA1/START domain
VYEAWTDPDKLAAWFCRAKSTFDKEIQMKNVIGMLAVGVLAMGSFAIQARAQEKQSGGFEKMKTLVGEWSATPSSGKTFTTTIRAVSNGTALEETFQNEKDNQMVTLYSPDGNRLALTHYCSMGNQPHMETPAITDPAGEFAFSYTGGTNMTASDPHMHSMVLKIEDADHFTESWTMHMDGKEQVETFHFVRKK